MNIYCQKAFSKTYIFNLNIKFIYYDPSQNISGYTNAIDSQNICLQKRQKAFPKTLDHRRRNIASHTFVYCSY